MGRSETVRQIGVLTSQFSLMLGFSWSSEQSGLGLVLEPEALAVDVDDDRVVQDAIQHRDGEHAAAGEDAVPATEGRIPSQDRRARP
jgi:hypothetical protein